MEDYEWGETDIQGDKGGKQAEDELEEIVKPKEWERKLAEKTRKKLKKKAKKERKEKKAAEVKTVSAGGITKPKREFFQSLLLLKFINISALARAVISAFGALGKIASKDGQVLDADSSDSEEESGQKVSYFILSLKNWSIPSRFYHLHQVHPGSFPSCLHPNPSPNQSKAD